MSQILHETGTLTESGRLVQGYKGVCGNLSSTDTSGVASQVGSADEQLAQPASGAVGPKKSLDGSLELNVGVPRNAAAVDAMSYMHMCILLLAAAVLL
jgi:hypothetical protein